MLKQEIYPPTLSILEEKNLITDAALDHGLLIKQKGTGNIIHAPFSLFPSPVSRQAFQNTVDIHTTLNKLFFKLSRDDIFIRKVMKSVIGVDNFMEKLFNIYTTVFDHDTNTQTISLGLNRSDYMLHSSENGLVPLQVEFNTISCGLVTLSSKVTELHQFVHKNDEEILKNLPTCNSIEGVPKGISAAHRLFNSKYLKNEESVVLMVVQPNEWNMFDQRGIEFKLLNKYGIKMMRKSLTEIFNEGKIADGNLVIDNKIISVVYFRAGYCPNDYPTEDEWTARLMMEKSSAVKSPDIAYHLVGLKKFQQILSCPNILKKYLTDPLELEKVRKTFTGLYPLDESEEGLAAYEMALNHPEKYVLKPQREGGGNNFYGNDIPLVLSKLSAAERRCFILMDLITPPTLQNLMVREGKISRQDVQSELGIFGVWLSDGEEVLINEECGHLLRTKKSTSTEGGVSKGISVIDSPYLV
ncbi:hypothetical protein HDU92_005110 [Lobulomyces angularis]|nr:hypothetical protein HDU92_005110 [Lobulomyces angularis]